MQPRALVEGATVRVSIDRGEAEPESRVRLLIGTGRAAVVRIDDASPHGGSAAIPVIELPPVADDWTAALVCLDGASTARPDLAAVALEQGSASITWPDGARTTHDLTVFRSAIQADRYPDRTPASGLLQRSTIT